MGGTERKGRERAEREHRITRAARSIAEREGWGAVTVRRLADEIEYSQPVLYSHFANRDAIVAAVAVTGFRELAIVLRHTGDGATDVREAITAAAKSYLAFAREQPSLYAAMFTLPSGLRFAEADTKPELREAFAALNATVALASGDDETATETFWAALHGLAELEGSGRIRPGPRDRRIAFVVNGLFCLEKP